VAVFNLYNSNGIVRYYVDLLRLDDAKTIEHALEGLDAILAHGGKMKASAENPFVREL
jgi:hypothetical protein